MPLTPDLFKPDEEVAIETPPTGLEAQPAIAPVEPPAPVVPPITEDILLENVPSTAKPVEPDPERQLRAGESRWETFDKDGKELSRIDVVAGPEGRTRVTQRVAPPPPDEEKPPEGEEAPAPVQPTPTREVRKDVRELSGIDVGDVAFNSRMARVQARRAANAAEPGTDIMKPREAEAFVNRLNRIIAGDTNVRPISRRELERARPVLEQYEKGKAFLASLDVIATREITAIVDQIGNATSREDIIEMVSASNGVTRDIVNDVIVKVLNTPEDQLGGLDIAKMVQVSMGRDQKFDESTFDFKFLTTADEKRDYYDSQKIKPSRAKTIGSSLDERGRDAKLQVLADEYNAMAGPGDSSATVIDGNIVYNKVPDSIKNKMEAEKDQIERVATAKRANFLNNSMYQQQADLLGVDTYEEWHSSPLATPHEEQPDGTWKQRAKGNQAEIERWQARHDAKEMAEYRLGKTGFTELTNGQIATLLKQAGVSPVMQKYMTSLSKVDKPTAISTSIGKIEYDFVPASANGDNISTVSYGEGGPEALTKAALDLYAKDNNISLQDAVVQTLSSVDGFMRKDFESVALEMMKAAEAELNDQMASAEESIKLTLTNRVAQVYKTLAAANDEFEKRNKAEGAARGFADRWQLKSDSKPELIQERAIDAIEEEFMALAAGKGATEDEVMLGIKALRADPFGTDVPPEMARAFALRRGALQGGVDSMASDEADRVAKELAITAKQDAVTKDHNNNQFIHFKVGTDQIEIEADPRDQEQVGLFQQYRANPGDRPRIKAQMDRIQEKARIDGVRMEIEKENKAEDFVTGWDPEGKPVRFQNDSIGVSRLLEYENADDAGKREIAKLETARIASRVKLQATSDEEINRMKDGYIRIATGVEVTVGDNTLKEDITYLKHSIDDPLSEQDFDEYQQWIVDTYGGQPEIMEKLKQQLANVKQDAKDSYMTTVERAERDRLNLAFDQVNRIRDLGDLDKENKKALKKAGYYDVLDNAERQNALGQEFGLREDVLPDAEMITVFTSTGKPKKVKLSSLDKVAETGNKIFVRDAEGNEKAVAPMTGDELKARGLTPIVADPDDPDLIAAGLIRPEAQPTAETAAENQQLDDLVAKEIEKSGLTAELSPVVQIYRTIKQRIESKQ